MIELVISVVAVLAMAITVRYHWITRRVPVRDTAPTGRKPWVRPNPVKHRYTDVPDPDKKGPDHVADHP